jgi:DNA-binding SARP family transcriptional activator
MKVREIDLTSNFWRMALLFNFCIAFFLPESSFSQSYGLGFNGQEFSKDLRTGVDLSPKGYLSFNKEFELSFKMLLRPNVKMYFGYIARIIDKQGRNIDLIFNYRSIDSSAIEVVCGQKLTKISFNADILKLCNKWTEFRLKIDLTKNKVSVYSAVNDCQIEDSGVNLSGDVKILFGMNDFSHFKTADLPSMKIKDICIYEKGKLSREWPLDETLGEKAYDKIRKQVALIKNPVWLKPEHTKWQKVNSSILAGNCEIAFNEKDEKIYLIGDDQLIIYSAKSNTTEKVVYKERANILLPGRQAFYNPDTKTIFSCDIDLKMVSEFDFNTSMWKQQVPPNSFATVFLHHNQYYSSLEKALYIFGGYGQHTYKNLIQKYGIGTGVWEVLKPTGEIFNPRYLAATGVVNDTAFILGGYGSVTGKQIINPQNYYDLMAFSLKDHKFRKVYDFIPPAEDLCFSNSMVIDPESRSFYALAFSVLKYDGYLQLVKGSLQKPEIKLIASKIPYSFHDVKSFSSLYYCESSQKLIAATMLLNNDKQTEINLYSISSPPNDRLQEAITSNTIPLRWTYLFLLVAIIFTFSLIFRKRIKRGNASKSNDPQNSHVLSETIASGALAEHKTPYRNSVFFFGGFQVFNSEGTDITCRFSPLLKELFLLIWLNSIKNNKGISSEKINEILWYDKDEKSASNNRAVNIGKLKQIIGEIDTCTLSHKTAYWKIDFDEMVVYNDYFECIKVAGAKKTITKEKINKLIDFSLKGIFLMNSNYEWLDEFKANISNNLIDILVELAHKQKIEGDPDFILRLADTIFIFDIVNEEAMILKCKALTLLGKHSLASTTFAKFSKEFEILYDKKYDKTFDEVLTMSGSS